MTKIYIEKGFIRKQKKKKKELSSNANFHSIFLNLTLL